MLISLTDMKSYLGIDVGNTDYDDFLTRETELISAAVEKYCGRIFSSDTYTQTFYYEDFKDKQPTKDLYLFHYPVISIASMLEGTEDISTITRVHNEKGKLIKNEYFFKNDSDLVVTYDAGFATIPGPIRSVVFALVRERYNKELNGVELDFGSNVQSVSIPGTVNVQFDYTLQANERRTGLGMILGNYVNILDMYRSERVLVGQIGDNFVTT